MNRTVAFVVFAILAALGLAGSVVLHVFRPDATATFAGLIVTVLGLVSVAAGTFHALGRQGEKIDRLHQETTTVKHQTNGTLSALLARNNDLFTENAALRAALPPNHPLNQKEPTK